jgi:hypothetical protein
MNLSRNSLFFIIFSCLFFIVPMVAHSATIKEQMAARIPAINALKDQGIVGENNMGFLEYRTAEKPQNELVNDENRDRNVVYEEIGKSQKAPAKLVGQRRAKMIAESGKASHWYQRPNGEWYTK